MIDILKNMFVLFSMLNPHIYIEETPYCNIQYVVARTPFKWLDNYRVEPSEYIVLICNMNLDDLKLLDKKGLVLEMKNNKQCAWEINLILYATTLKDAAMLVFSDEEHWLNYEMETDMAYWEKEYLN